jgi:Helix-turn-helix.
MYGQNPNIQDIISFIDIFEKLFYNVFNFIKEDFMDTADKYIGEQIRRFRVYSHITQDELASKVGLTKQIISRIEKGERKVAFKELEKIAEYLDQPIEIFTTIDLKYKLINRRHRSVDIPKYSLEFLEDWEAFLLLFKNDDTAMLIKEEIKQEMDNIYHKVYGTFKFLRPK